MVAAWGESTMLVKTQTSVLGCKMHGRKYTSSQPDQWYAIGYGKLNVHPMLTNRFTIIFVFPLIV